jgi:hypothetical protein
MNRERDRPDPREPQTNNLEDTLFRVVSRALRKEAGRPGRMAEMLARPPGGTPTSGRTVEEADLQQVGFVNLFQRAAKIIVRIDPHDFLIRYLLNSRAAG